jgi:hypothetical protein
VLYYYYQKKGREKGRKEERGRGGRRGKGVQSEDENFVVWGGDYKQIERCSDILDAFEFCVIVFKNTWRTASANWRTF